MSEMVLEIQVFKKMWINFWVSFELLLLLIYETEKRIGSYQAATYGSFIETEANKDLEQIQKTRKKVGLTGPFWLYGSMKSELFLFQKRSGHESYLV